MQLVLSAIGRYHKQRAPYDPMDPLLAMRALRPAMRPLSQEDWSSQHEQRALREMYSLHRMKARKPADLPSDIPQISSETARYFNELVRMERAA